MPRGAPRAGGSARYACHGRHATGHCPAPSKISEKLANAYVERVFLEGLARTPIAAEGMATTATLDASVATLEHAEAELALYRDATVLTAIGKAAYVAGLQRRSAEVEEARAEVAREQSSQARGDVGRRALLDAWPTLSEGAKREHLAAAIDAVFIRRGDPALRGKISVADVAPRIHIAWRAEVPLASLPGRGRRVPPGPFAFPDEAPGNVRVAAP
jgi:hypothetical protein